MATSLQSPGIPGNATPRRCVPKGSEVVTSRAMTLPDLPKLAMECQDFFGLAANHFLGQIKTVGIFLGDHTGFQWALTLGPCSLSGLITCQESQPSRQ